MAFNQAPYQRSGRLNGMEGELLALQEEVSNLTERLDLTEKPLMSGGRDQVPGGSE